MNKTRICLICENSYVVSHGRQVYCSKKCSEQKAIRLKAYQVVSRKEKPECVNCGCDYLPLLEINHKNYDGFELRKNGEPRGYALWLSVIKGERVTDDLDVRCSVCNWAYLHEFRHKIKNRHRIIKFDAGFKILPFFCGFFR